MSDPPRRTALAVLAVCFVLGLLGRGLIESFVVFLLPLSREFGWDRATVTSIYSLATLSSGLVAPFVGRVFDRSGPRAVYAIGLSLLGAALLTVPFADRLWEFQLCIGIGVGIGAACLGNVPNSALLARWFKARLTTAMSLLYSGFGIGILILVPVAQLLSQQLGWRGAYQALGAGVVLLAVPILLLPWRLYRAGSPDLAPRASGASGGLHSWTLIGALRHRAFWGLFSVFMFTGIAMFAIVVQVVAYLVEIGFTPMQAATAWGFSGILLPIGMITVGWLDGLIGRRASVLLSYAVTMLGMLQLWLLGHFPNVWLLGGFVLCFGGTLGSRGPLISAIAMRLFHGGAVATIFGMITVGSGLGSAFGSWAGGLLHDWTGSYEPVIGFAFLSIVCGMLPFLIVPELKR